MSSDEIKSLQDLRDYLQDWLARFRKAQKALPFIQKMKENVDWEYEALSNLPEEAIEIPKPDFPAMFLGRYNYITVAVPMLPEIGEEQLWSSTGFMISGSSVSLEYVGRIGDLETPAAKKYSSLYVGQYQKIQNSQKRKDDVHDLLRKLSNPQTLNRFDSASDAIALYKSDASPRTSVAHEVRNLLDGVKGDLFSIAKKWEKENMTWEEMARRISIGGEGSFEYQQVIKQKSVYSSLLDRLGHVLHDREGGSITDLDQIWNQVLDHLYTVLALINISV